MALGAFFVPAAVIAGCGSDVPGDSVAVVAGNPITTQAFNHWMYVAAKGQAAQSPGQPVIVPNDPPNFKNCVAQVKKDFPTLAKQSDTTLKSDCNQLFTSLSSQVMDFLIKSYWYQADAARQHVTVSNAQVQKVFNSAKKQQFPTESAFQTFLTQTGQTLDDIVYRFKINQIYQKLLAKHNGTVTDAQVAAYYSANKSKYGTPETRNMRIVLAKSSAQADAAKAALASGQSWNAVAKKYSIDTTTKNTGGQLTGVTKGQEDTALDAAAFSAAENKVLGPVHGQFGYYVFEVTKITNATQQTLAQATPAIRQALTSQQQTTAQSAVDTTAKQHWLSQTKCRVPYAMSDCSGYKAPKTSTPSIPQGGATTGATTPGG